MILQFSRHTARWSLASLLCAAPIVPLAAQEAHPAPVGAEVFVNSEPETYLRLLQVTGRAPLYPWSLRAFGPEEIARLSPTDSVHPWASRYDFSAPSGVRLIPPRARVIYNSTFPSGTNDGAVWAGRGLTTAVEAGIVAHAGPLSLTLAPILFRTENRAFELQPTGHSGRLEFADPRSPTNIDLPQRFGTEPYTRLDPGQSTLRLDVAGMAVGVSTANEHWGPALRYPILLGNNAPGFPHAFVGTSRPVDLRLATVHARVLWGVLEQSVYAVIEGEGSRRYASGLALVLMPAGIPGLEVGGARFFHTRMLPEHPLRSIIRQPFEEIIPGDQTNDDANQLASVFFRWVAPGNGFEVYGEYGREDYNADFRDLMLEPDHDAAYLIGLQRVWELTPARWLTLGAEVVNAQITQLQRARTQTPFYRHTPTAQGHTNLGQILGSPAVYGGSGAQLSVEYHHPGGRQRVLWARELVQETGRFPQTGVSLPDGLNVLHRLGVESVLFRGRWEVAAGLAAEYEFNRHIRDDAFNLNTTLGVRRSW